MVAIRTVEFEWTVDASEVDTCPAGGEFGRLDAGGDDGS